jgi:radical SAM superfamily enzyme YgiQ (UPF0313 family)
VKKEMYAPVGLLTLATILKKAGHTVQVITNQDTMYVLGILKTFKPEFVGLTINTFQVKYANELLHWIKYYYYDIKIIVGGPHVTATNYYDGNKYIDFVCKGESEESIVGIIEGHTKGKVITQSSRTLLDNVPIPDLSFVYNNAREYKGSPPFGPTPTITMMASRGCPFNCIFCSKAIFGKTVTYMSPQRVVDEVEYYHHLGFKEVFFQDDTFNLNLDWSFEILRGLRRLGLHRSMVFRAPFRVNKNLITKEILEEFKATGFWLLFYSVEAGNDKLLKDIKKGITVEEIKRAFILTHSVGIRTEASFITGFPTETIFDVKDRINLLKDLAPYWSGCGIATPFPGTELYNQIQSNLILEFRNKYEVWQPGLIYYIPDNLTREDIMRSSALMNTIGRIQQMKNLLISPKYAYYTMKGLK